MKDMDWLFLLCVIGFGAYGVFYLFKSVQMLISNRKVRREFLSNHQEDQISKKDTYRPWVLAETAAFIYCIYSVITISDEMEQAGWFRLAFAMIGVIMLGQIMLNIVKGRVLTDEKGFVYENDYVPFQNVISMDPKRNLIFTLVDILCVKNKKYTMPGKIGQFTHDAYLEYRKAKKAGKKKQ